MARATRYHLPSLVLAVAGAWFLRVAAGTSRGLAMLVALVLGLGLLGVAAESLRRERPRRPLLVLTALAGAATYYALRARGWLSVLDTGQSGAGLVFVLLPPSIVYAVLEETDLWD